jgi:hypothetical protein
MMTRSVPPGRWLKASREAWSRWAATNAAADWDAAQWGTAERLLQLTDDFGRCKAPDERRRMAPQLRTLERDLGLIVKKPKPTTDDDVKKLDRARERAWCRLHFGESTYGQSGGDLKRACDLWHELLLPATTVVAPHGEVSGADQAMIDHCVAVHGYLREDFTFDTRDPRQLLDED